MCLTFHKSTLFPWRPRYQPRIHQRASTCGPLRVADRGHQVSVIKNIRAFQWKSLTQIASLLAASFYDDADAWHRGTARAAGPPGLDATLFGWASLWAIVLQHVLYGSRHVTLLAGADDQVVGCCGLTLEPAPSDMRAAAGLPPTSWYALLTGLAVDPAHRRQGVGSRLLGEAAAVAGAWRPQPGVVALLVARTNTAAIRLYERSGFEEQSSWTDERWREEAERGKVGKPRRLLLTKRLTPQPGTQQETQDADADVGNIA